MIWITFLVSAGIIVFASMKLAEFGDAVALRTGLGGMFIGILLMAGATSLPELLTTINSINQDVPDLAAGNLFGSNMFNMFLLAMLDLSNQRKRILRSAMLKHGLTGSLTVLISTLVVFSILADLDFSVGWVGIDSVFILLAYGVALRLIQKTNVRTAGRAPVKRPVVPPGTPSLFASVLGFGLATALLVLVTPYLVSSSAGIAEVTGLGATFVGSTLVAIVTSLPELVTTFAAAKLGADDMAIGNLFGSNMFNMFALGLTDVFYLPGRFLGVIDPAFTLIALIGLLMTAVALVGNLAKIEHRLGFVEIDALLLILMYFGGLYLLYMRGLST
ncbi:MAG TPA: hypothetical protein VFF68_01405 [Anaerolineaceae bacterium]|nr:hypothetical protein [Anaerolineaceae bacterium]